MQADGSTVTVREPEFDPEQVAYLLAYEQLVTERGTHGIPMQVATDPVNEFKFVAEDIPLVDFAARLIGQKQDAYYKKYPDASRHGHLWRPPHLPD